MHAFGAMFVEVAVDPNLGKKHVQRIISAYGAGHTVTSEMTRNRCIGVMIGGICITSWSVLWWTPAMGRP